MSMLEVPINIDNNIADTKTTMKTIPTPKLRLEFINVAFLTLVEAYNNLLHPETTKHRTYSTKIQITITGNINRSALKKYILKFIEEYRNPLELTNKTNINRIIQLVIGEKK
jgi:hypothetical protein